MSRSIHRAFLIAATGLMVALPIGFATGEEPPTKDQLPGAQAYAVQQMPCAARGEVVKMLRDRFGETPIAHGVAHTGAVAEVFLGPKGTWSIVATAPNGMSCMVGSGENWQSQISHDDTI
jgi:hypothetical protein